MNRPETPPEMDFFVEPRPAPGERTVCLRIGPLEVELQGLDDELAGTLLERFDPFTQDGAGSADTLRVRVGLEPVDYFIDPPEKAELQPVFLAFDETRVRYLGYQVAGWLEPEGDRGVMLLSRGDYEPAGRAMENYLRVAIAWRAVTRGGALVHAASAVLDGKGYLFYGPSGAGKSTLSACNKRASVVSDDLSLVFPGDDGTPQLIGSPFRGTYEEGPMIVGSFPLVAGYRLVQAAEARVEDVARIRAFAQLVANLPFVAESFPRRPNLLVAVQKAFEGVPLAHLHFRKDETYWDAILATR